jgi:hypothetical protein
VPLVVVEVVVEEVAVVVDDSVVVVVTLDAKVAVALVFACIKKDSVSLPKDWHVPAQTVHELNWYPAAGVANRVTRVPDAYTSEPAGRVVPQEEIPDGQATDTVRKGKATDVVEEVVDETDVVDVVVVVEVVDVLELVVVVVVVDDPPVEVTK